MALARFKAVEVEHLVDEGPRAFIHGFPPIWKSSPATTKIKAQDSGSPSWTEEQRVTRACWRLQLIYDLKRAAERGKLAWSAADISELGKIAAIYPPTETTNSQDRYMGPPNGLYNWFQSRWIMDEFNRDHAEFEEILAVVQHVKNKYGQDSADKMANGYLSSKDLQGHRELQREWPLPGPCKGDDWRMIIHASYAVAHYQSLGMFCVNDPGSWKRVVSFDPYAHLGFAFWSPERLEKHGFCRVVTKRGEMDPVPFAWYSILGPEERNRVEREIKEVKEKPPLRVVRA